MPILYLFYIVFSLFILFIPNTTIIPFNIDLGFFNLPFTAPATYIKFFIIASIVAKLSLFIFRDYSKIIPQIYNIDLSYHQEDIEKALKHYSHKDLKKYNIASDWKQRNVVVWNQMMEKIHHKLGQKINFSEDIEEAEIKGYGYIYATKCGILTYDILSSGGVIDHTVSKKYASKTINIYTRCATKRAERIKIGLKHILKRYLILPIKYRQCLYLTEGLYNYISVTAITKFKFFPTIEIGVTIHLYEDANDSKMVPIGRAINTPFDNSTPNYFV